MTLREGTGPLIERLRRLVDDGTAGVWDDAELQDILDLHKLRVFREQMERERAYTSGGSVEYKVFHSRWGDFESGTLQFRIEDVVGTTRGTADFTADYVNGVFTMAADQGGTALFVTGWTFDLYGAAADCWRERATKTSGLYDVNLDGHRLTRSQWHKHCMENARLYDARARVRTVRQWSQE